MEIDKVHVSARSYKLGWDKDNIRIRQPRHSFSTLAHRETFVWEQQVPSKVKTHHVCAQRPDCTLTTPGLEGMP